MVERAALCQRYAHRVRVPTVQCPGLKSQPDLFKIAGALNLQRFGFGASQGRQQHSRQNCDDGNYDQEFDQSECPCRFPESFHKRVPVCLVWLTLPNFWRSSSASTSRYYSLAKRVPALFLPGIEEREVLTKSSP